jgi:hypothetical protein
MLRAGVQGADPARPAADNVAGCFCLCDGQQEEIMPDRDVLIQRLTEVNEEFRRLRHEHQDHERELTALQTRPFLTPEQQWRVSELKKLKLIAKDRMEALIRQSRPSAQTRA